MSVLEDAICFGKVLFVIKPVVSQRVATVQTKLESECEALFSGREQESYENLQELSR